MTDFDSFHPSWPSTLHIVGRGALRENVDICGQYRLFSVLHGKPAYQQQGTCTVIRFWPPSRRWVIDRGGLRDSAVAVAFAQDVAYCVHPARSDLIWNVWESAQQSYVPDMEMVTTAAPGTVAFVGRAYGRPHSELNGHYKLRGVCMGMPFYIHVSEDLIVRYCPQEQRWLISNSGDVGSQCRAFADAGTTEHPGSPELNWFFCEGHCDSWCVDRMSKMLVAPSEINVAGRNMQAENARINGTYLLAGVIEGHPAYALPGTCSLIRFSSATERWLIDTDALLEPSLTSRLYHLMFRPDLSSPGDRCAAYAESDDIAGSQAHPANLDWFVWDSKQGRHILDPSVYSTTAPKMLQVWGRAHGRENQCINGDYILEGGHCGRPLYRMQEPETFIRYYPPGKSWIISSSFREGGACIAWASCRRNSEYPGDLCSCWNVHESSRGAFLPDPALHVCDSTSAGEHVPTCMDDDRHAPIHSIQELQMSQRHMEPDWQTLAHKTGSPSMSSVMLRRGCFGA